MALLLHELEWADEPLVPRVPDAAWEAEVTALMGVVPDPLRRISPSLWVRRAYLDALRKSVETVSDAEMELAMLVVSQENACRYCYGIARTRLRRMGLSEERVDQVERRAQLAEGDDRERELVRFCRDLARSKPRPAKKAREAMAEVGFTPQQTAELAYIVAMGGFGNRIATLIAAEPETELEKTVDKRTLWKRLSSMRLGKTALSRLPPPSYPAPHLTGPFAGLVRLLEGSPAASTLEAALDGAFASERLPQRSLALIFAVIARTLECRLCETAAAEVLDAQGVGPAVRKEVLATLGSPALTELEVLVIPWARETVWMPEQPASIQERSRPLVDAIGSEMFIEVVGAAALANASVRIAMLEE